MTAAQIAGPGTTPGVAATIPQNVQDPTDACRVLVVGSGDGSRVRWALTQVWRRAGRPLLIQTRGSLVVGVEAWAWYRAHSGCGIDIVRPVDEHRPDVLLVFGPASALSAQLRAALPLARRAGLVVDGDTVGEFR